jgi:hypothetical protein
MQWCKVASADKSQSSRHIPCAVHTVVGTFHVPSTWNPGNSLTANGTAERACYFCHHKVNRGNFDAALP